MQWQLIWSDWYMLWPKWEKVVLYDEDFDFSYSDNYFFFGPLQMHWYGSA